MQYTVNGEFLVNYINQNPNARNIIIDLFPSIKDDFDYAQVGYWYRNVDTGDLYLLAAVGNGKVALINRSGFLFSPPTDIRDAMHITMTEFAKLVSSPEKYKRVFINISYVDAIGE